jgi:plastocyanin
MRFNGLALVVGAMAIAACSSGDQNAQNTSATQNDTAAAPATQNTGTGATGTASMAAITGRTHEVRMVGDGQSYKYEPASLTIKQGDGVKWIMVSGAPHNVAFQNVPDAAKAQLSANMPSQLKELTSPMMMNANENYTVSFANVATGTYNYVCEPHAAMNMRGQITVQP